MSRIDAAALYALLPAIHRIRDEAEPRPGGALRALIDVLASQAALVEADIEQLYENAFIETCDEWVVPYIGDLVGNRPLARTAASRRGDVARTLYYRRRKGTLPMLEELARDVTGWPARAVAFHELLGWTQHVNHVRHHVTPGPRLRPATSAEPVGTADLRNLDALDRVGGPFDTLSHTVDVRRIAREAGWHGIDKVGFFLWRLAAFPLQGRTVEGPGGPSRPGVTPRRATAPNAHGYHFNPLGAPGPLFTHSTPDDDPTRRAREHEVSGAIRPLAFRQDPGRYYGPGKSVAVFRNAEPIPPQRIRCMSLRGWARPPAGMIGLDVRLGRFTFAAGEEPGADETVAVDWTYGVAGNVGGGPYDRRRSVVPPDDPHATIHVNPPAGVSGAGTAAGDVAAAIQAWIARGRPSAVIAVHDSATHELPASIELAAGRWLHIVAANGQRPLLRPPGGSLVLTEAVSGADAPQALRLDGVVIEGALHVAGNLLALRLEHVTLVPGLALDERGEPATPGAASLRVDGGVPGQTRNERIEVEVLSSITGAIEIPGHAGYLRVADSIVDGLGNAAIAGPAGEAGPRLLAERTTVLGDTRVHLLEEASETIFTGQVHATRRQAGCMRFSYAAPGSRTPRRHRCQPDLALAAATTARGQALDDGERARIERSSAPVFAARRYGHPAYADLHPRGPVEIAHGGEDGGEMGAFASQARAARAANLRMRLDEYLPAGLEPGLLDVPPPGKPEI